ncbi:diphthine--ammonia ligase isoform X2 [Esox lucius]|uniref:Diphthine--ammonia ligase n=1 Tax=Esox lucius TaxID=8010 RepID=A0A3P8ZMI7_ESOLU|nr:diphthine--ammonia ligase isoform X2 [Esox lucius]
MKVVALISGGKDSCYNMMQCVAAGHSVVALANLRPANTDELDSYMYQTVGHQAIDLYAEAMDLPLYRRTIQGSSLEIGRVYSQTEGDEVEDLYHLLKMVQEKESVEGVSVGAILSDYQRTRVENVCARLGLQSLAYLWRRDQTSLLSEMISCGVHALLIKVAAVGLDPEKHLGKPLADMEPYLTQLSQKYGVHVCGEGGEYETFTVDCPLFKKRLVIDSVETVIHSADAFAPVGYLHFSQMHTENKEMGPVAASALPLGGCPCQSAVDEMTDEAEYADQAEDVQEESTSKGDLSCHKGREFPNPVCDLLPVDVLLSCSARSPGGYQWISGIKPLTPDEGIESQTAAAFTLLQGELEMRGCRMKHIVLVHLYVRDMQDFSLLNKVYATHFGVNPPARVCVQVPLPVGQLLQMDCLLHDWPSEPQEAPEEAAFHHREALHVQSLSHWAPANIGPYSQAFRVDETVFCAGQIALVPCTMQLVSGGTGTQARLSFSHVEKVLEAVIGSLTLNHVLQAHCYVTRSQDIPIVRGVWDGKLGAAQKEEWLGGPAPHCSPLAVVVVPFLPRGAAVELHVTAAHDDPRHRKSSHVTAEVPCGTVECHATMSSDCQCAAVSLALVVPGLVPAVQGLDQEILGALGATLQSARQKWGEGGCLFPLCARVFYKYDDALARRLVTGLEEFLKTALHPSSPSVASVPVLDLPDSAILLVSCWFGL